MRTRPQHLLIAATLTLTTAGLPLFGGQAAATDRVVVVRAGQTLSQIAAQQGVSIERLVRLNRLADPNRIFVGQRLRISRSAQASRSSAPARSPAVTHRVASGDTLWAIAARYRTRVTAIVAANRIGNPSFIRVGQVLTIPGAAAPASRQPAKAPAVTHRVASGETLWAIAARYRTSVTAIVAANRVGNPSFIRVGQVLTIPGGSTRPASAAPSGNAGRRPGTAHGGMSAAMAAAVAARQDIARLIVREARAQGVPATFALAVAWQESGWQARVVSSAGAIGVMQLLPSTAEWVAQTMLGRSVNPWDPASNVRTGVRLLKHYLARYGGNRSLALAAYYQGQAAADRHGVYAVSRPYISSILALERLFSR